MALSEPLEPLRIVLEFARANDAGDPHAFRFAPQSYLVRGERGDFTSAEIGWSRELLEDLEALRLPGRDPAALNRVGDVLRHTLGPAGWRQREGAIVDAVAEGRPVSVTVRSAAAELYALPWELLTLRSTGQSLGAVGGVLLRYEWPATTTARPRERSETGQGRVLIAWSAAGGAVPATEHVDAIRRAYAGAGRELDEARDVLEHVSYGRLADVLAEAERAAEPIDALHLLCHGGAAGSTFGLVFDGESDGARSVVVDPSRIQQLLAPHAGMIRLVVVAACDSGNAGSPGNRLGSVAQMLHRVGIAAVVASRYPLSVNGSTRLTEVLYRELLAGGRTLEEAFIGARTALARDPTTLDWASVQLYARADDGDATLPLGALGPTAASAAAVAGGAEQAGGVVPPAPEKKRRSRTSSVAVVAVLAAAALALIMWLGFSLSSTPEEVGISPAGATSGALTTKGQGSAADASTTGASTAGASTAGASTAGTSTAGASTAGTSRSGASTAAGTRAAIVSAEAETSPSTTSTTSPTSPTSPSTKTSKKARSKAPSTKPSSTKPVTTRCSKSLVEYIETKVGAPDGGGAFSVRVKVAEGGAVSMTACSGCTDPLKTSARSKLGAISRARVVSKGGEEMPCIAGFEWD